MDPFIKWTINNYNILFYFQVNFIKDDGQVIHFNNPKVQASLGANTFAVMGHAETKRKCEIKRENISSKYCYMYDYKLHYL